MGRHLDCDHCSIQNSRLGCDVFRTLKVQFGRWEKILGLGGVWVAWVHFFFGSEYYNAARKVAAWEGVVIGRGMYTTLYMHNMLEKDLIGWFIRSII